MRSKNDFVLAALSAAVMAWPTAGQAQVEDCVLPAGNYALKVQIGGDCGAAATTTAQAFFDKLDTNATSGLRSVLPGYTSTSVAQAVARFNGVTLNLSFPDAGSTLQFSIPELGYTRTITGASRDNSIDALVDDLKKGDVLGQIMSYQARTSPTSPITGVGGLIPSVIATDFDQNFTGFATNIAAPQQDARGDGSSDNLAGAALTIGSFTSRDAAGLRNRVRVATLPLSYTFRNGIDPRRQLALSLPLTQVDVNGAKSYAAGLGLAYRVPMNDRWTLVPSGRASALGSADLATVSGVYTLGLTSVYVWDLGRYTVAMGNMLSYNATMKFQSGDYAFDPRVSNTALRNGLLASHPVLIDGRRMSFEYSLVDTRFIGGVKPYVSNYQEFGLTLGTNKNAYAARSFVRGGLTYTRGKGTRGLAANIGYWF